MSDILTGGFPPQLLSFSKKTKKWRKAHLDWADSKTFFNYSPVRNSVIHKKINYDLYNGKLHMQDLCMILNPDSIKAKYIPESIQHYPIINSKINVLKGEEIRRTFDFRVVVTNPNAVSQKEEEKKREFILSMEKLIADTSISDQDFQKKSQEVMEYYQYQWLDLREIRANAVIQHYSKELNMPFLFNQGFLDGMIVGEEIYQCDIVGGEPTLCKLNPNKVRVFKSGFSNRIEDADMIIIEDYWSPGRILDTFYDALTEKDRKYIELLPNNQGNTDAMDNVDERFGFINGAMLGEEFVQDDNFFWDPLGYQDGTANSLLPYDTYGNVRVLKVFWKSKRKIKKVKSYDPKTGEEVFTFYPETYVINEDMGEEEEIYWINEAWEGTKIGTDIYVNMKPRVVQYNRIDNPSRCHFGIIGSIYNVNETRPMSLVDAMKPYSYLYDVIHDRLNKLLAKNWGKIITLDLALVPEGWDVEKWLYFAKTNSIAVRDSFKEGNYGAAIGKIAGGLNNASSGVIDAELGNSIQLHINLLEFIKMEMSDVAGISRQREGQISNRETVGGVERATLQSSHITEWLFVIHEDVKKRVIEAFLETAKAAMKGRGKKFSYILPDNSIRIINIDGDEFAECDYGLIVDNSEATQKLGQKLDMLALAAIQNNALSFSTIMKLYNSASLAEKERLIEINERQIQQQQQELQQQQQQMQQQQIEAAQQQQAMELLFKDQINQRDNETKVLVALINSLAEADRLAIINHDDEQEEEFTEEARANLMEKMRQFDARLKLDRERLEFDKDKLKQDAALKQKQINKLKSTNTKK